MLQRGQKELASFINAQAQTIYIDDETSPRQGKYLNTITTISPLPAFDKNNQLTKLLYSKLIVKGVKPFNHDLMLSHLKKSSQHCPSRKTTRDTTQHTKDAVVKNASVKRQITSHSKQLTDKAKIFDFSMERCLQRQSLSLANLNKNTRPSSGFQRSNNKISINRPQSASLKILHRPQSPYTTRPASASSRNPVNRRPQSSFERTSANKKPQYYEYELEKTSKILTISQSNPNMKTVDFIQKNKREASSRKRSVYLTSSEVPNHVILKSGNIKADIKREKPQQPNINRQILTKSQKERITAKQKEYLQYMKQNMPVQYQECIQFLLKQEQQGQDEAKSIISCSLGQEQPISMTSKQLQEFQVQEFYKDFLNKCLNIEHNINKSQVKKQQASPISSILNCDQTAHLLQLFKQVQYIRHNQGCYEDFNKEIRQIVKNLSFFREVRKEVLKSIFEMEYQIISVEENQTVIPHNSEIKYVYVILNGSVTKQNAKQQDQTILLDLTEPPEYLTTLFDGQIFGLPNKNNDKILQYSIKTIEKCLFMLLPYHSYRLALSSNQNIQDRIEILKSIFPSHGKYKFSKQDYQTMAYQMETATYAAQQVIVRQGQKRDELIFIAAGNAAICFESVIKRRKDNIDPLIKSRQQIIKQIQISDLRRSNLVNYSLLFQNAREMHYYLSQIMETKIRGDVLNWKNFHESLITSKQQGREPNQMPFEYSLMSTQNNTKVYLLSPSKILELSDHIRKCIEVTASQNSAKFDIKRDQQSIDKWEQFKIKICNDILTKKGKR